MFVNHIDPKAYDRRSSQTIIHINYFKAPLTRLRSHGNKMSATFSWHETYARQAEPEKITAPVPKKESQPASQSAVAPQHKKTILDIDISNNTYLNFGDAEGFITFNEHLILVRWSKFFPIPQDPTYKRSIEKLAVEAANMKCQTEVIILYVSCLPISLSVRSFYFENTLTSISSQVRTVSMEGKRKERKPVYYDRHFVVWFPKMDRRAHVYVGPGEEMDVEKLIIWRRQKHPNVVLC